MHITNFFHIYQQSYKIKIKLSYQLPLLRFSYDGNHACKDVDNGNNDQDYDKVNDDKDDSDMDNED